MAENEFRSNKLQATNWWKWAFIGLVTFIVVLVLYFISLIQPTTINEINTEKYENSTDEIVLTTELNKADTEQLLNTFLSEMLSENDPEFRIALDEALNIDGAIEFLGFEIPFTMVFIPYVLENGNLQLRAMSVQLASFSLPVSTVMSLLASQVEWPDFVVIDSESQIIVVNLNELDSVYDINVRLTLIDLVNDEIRFNIYIPNAIFKESLQSLN